MNPKTKIILIASVIAWAVVFTWVLESAKKPTTSFKGCVFPTATERLVAVGTDSGTPVCSYHPKISWGAPKNAAK